MKKFFAGVLCVTLLFSVCGCGVKTPKVKEKSTLSNIKGVWISYIELDALVKSGDFNGGFSSAVKRCADFGITDIFLHVVPFCDAVYHSDTYPLRDGYGGESEDVLKTAVAIAHKNGIRIHAWLNPYRVKTSDNDISALKDGTPAKKWLCDQDGENDKNVLVCDGGVYLNPAESEVRRTVISAVRELCENYDIDGIHLDDYFYPTTDAAFDSVSYQKYCLFAKNPISLAEYRRSAVNALVSGCYTAVKFENKDLIFSISPAASIKKDYESYYADVSAWCKSECVDLLIPQLYFGFDYPDENYRFDRLLGEWKEVVCGTTTELAIGLAAYKVGTDQLPDREEWANGDEVLSRQAQLCKEDKDIKGVVYYSFSTLPQR